MNAVLECRTNGAAQTLAAGQALGAMLRPGDVLALCGPLGAGKTQLVKGVALGIGVPADEPVVSPTFVLVREYRGRVTLYHLDAYRLSGTGELLALGFEEMLSELNAVVSVEWADRTPEAIPDSACRVELAHGGGDARAITITWAAERIAELTQAFTAAGIACTPAIAISRASG